jgi:hypothetical protein
MNKPKPILILLLIFAVLFQFCAPKKQKEDTGQKSGVINTVADSLEAARKQRLEREKAIRDSIIAAEEKIALGDIRFDVNRTQFSNQRASFLGKCKLRESDFYKGIVVLDYKFAGYGFENINSRFRNDSLCFVQLTGPKLGYDEFDQVNPDQVASLVGYFKKKYGEPTSYQGLPKSGTLGKGTNFICASWTIGKKTIAILANRESVNYRLNLEVVKSANIK